MYLWYFPKKCRGTGMNTPGTPPNASVCVQEKQGRKIKSQNEGGGKEIKLRSEYTPLRLRKFKLTEIV